jgi:hypothetical protein
LATHSDFLLIKSAKPFIMLLVFLCIAILAGLLIYGLLTYNDHKNVRQRYFAELKMAENRLAAARKDFELLDKPLQGLISKQFGNRMAENVKTETISTGMPSELLLVSWGEPAQVWYATDEMNKEVWYYDPFTTPEKETAYRTEITIEQNRVSTWKDRN